MSDTHRRFQTIRKALNGLYPFESQGNVARHLNTLTAMICGIVGSQRTNLPQIAGKAPTNRILRESLIKRFSRWIDNDHIDLEIYYLPYAEALITCLEHLPLTLVLTFPSHPPTALQPQSQPEPLPAL